MQLPLPRFSGCWILYDDVRLEGTDGFEVVSLKPETHLVDVKSKPVWIKDGSQSVQPVDVTLRHIGEKKKGGFVSGWLRGIAFGVGQWNLSCQLKGSCVR